MSAELSADYAGETELDQAYRVIKAQRQRSRQDGVMTTAFEFERWECVNDGTESHDGRDREDPLEHRCPKCVPLYRGPDPEPLPRRPWR